jgi:hypothetical protein
MPNDSAQFAPPMPQSLAEIAQYAALLRDVGIVLGFPVLVTIALRMHAKHIAILQAQVDLAKATQLIELSHYLNHKRNSLWLNARCWRAT